MISKDQFAMIYEFSFGKISLNWTRFFMETIKSVIYFSLAPLRDPYHIQRRDLRAFSVNYSCLLFVTGNLMGVLIESKKNFSLILIVVHGKGVILSHT